MRRRGSILIQLLVGTAIMVVVMGALLQVLMSLWRMTSFSTDMPGSQDDARGIALRVADAFRSATLCTSSDSGCTLNAAIESPSSSVVTIYRRNLDGTLSELTYGVSNGNFTLSTGGTTTTFSTGATLTLTYYGSSSYYSNGLTSFTPTASTAPNLAAVGIVATTTTNGQTARFETFVRLRNSPKPTTS